MRGFSRRTIELIEHARILLEANHPQTLRQLHYAIFSRNEVEYDNTPADYKRLSRVTTDSRRRYREYELQGCLSDERLPLEIPPEWIVDESREPETPSMWTNVHGYLDAVRRSYHRDN